MKERWLFILMMLFLLIPLSISSDGVYTGKDENSGLTINKFEKTSGKNSNKGCD